MKLSKYEDCLAAIAETVKGDDVAQLKATLTDLEQFFKDRIGAKSARDEKDGLKAVKTAIEGKRGWKPYEDKPTAPPPAGGGGLGL